MAGIGKTRRPLWLRGRLELTEEAGEQLGCVSQDLSKEPLRAQSRETEQAGLRPALGHRMSEGWLQIRAQGLRAERRGLNPWVSACIFTKGLVQTYYFPKRRVTEVFQLETQKTLCYTHLPHTLNLTKGKKKFCCHFRNSLSTLILFFHFFFNVNHTFWAAGLRFLPFCFSKWSRSLKSRGLSSLQKQCPSPPRPVVTSGHCESPAPWSSPSPCYLTTPQ